jgi:hypothetical protein
MSEQTIDDIIKAKDLRISELLAEIQLLKENAQIDNLTDLEITIDSNEITESIQLKTFPEEEEEEDIMKLLSTFMNNNDASGNPFGDSGNLFGDSGNLFGDSGMSNIIQQMMSGNNDSGMANIIQQMMGGTNEDTSKDL